MTLLTLLSWGGAVVVPEPEHDAPPARIDDWSDVEPIVWHPLPEKRPVDADALVGGMTVVASVGEVTAEGEADAWADPITVAAESDPLEAKGAKNLPEDVLVAMLLTF